ncbi:hypothetical protein LEMLEM_LOCUS18208 [Lemmus lemmus]
MSRCFRASRKLGLKGGVACRSSLSIAGAVPGFHRNLGLTTQRQAFAFLRLRRACRPPTPADPPTPANAALAAASAAANSVDLLVGRQLLQAFAVRPLGVDFLGRADPS